MNCTSHAVGIDLSLQFQELTCWRCITSVRREAEELGQSLPRRKGRGLTSFAGWSGEIETKGSQCVRKDGGRSSGRHLPKLLGAFACAATLVTGATGSRIGVDRRVAYARRRSHHAQSNPDAEIRAAARRGAGRRPRSVGLWRCRAADGVRGAVVRRGCGAAAVARRCRYWRGRDHAGRRHWLCRRGGRAWAGAAPRPHAGTTRTQPRRVSGTASAAHVWSGCQRCCKPTSGGRNCR